MERPDLMLSGKVEQVARVIPPVMENFSIWWWKMKPFERFMYLNEWQLTLTAPAGEKERRAPSSNSDF